MAMVDIMAGRIAVRENQSIGQKLYNPSLSFRFMCATMSNQHPGISHDLRIHQI